MKFCVLTELKARVATAHCPRLTAHDGQAREATPPRYISRANFRLRCAAVLEDGWRKVTVTRAAEEKPRFSVKDDCLHPYNHPTVSTITIL